MNTISNTTQNTVSNTQRTQTLKEVSTLLDKILVDINTVQEMGKAKKTVSVTYSLNEVLFISIISAITIPVTHVVMSLLM